jgi:putative endonuclease
VYLLVLANGAYYAGYAGDVQQRLQRHLRGTGSRLTRSFPPVRLAQCWRVSGGRSRAQQIEAFLKSCSRADKHRLASEPDLLAVWLRQRRGLRVRPKPCSLNPNLRSLDQPE